MECTVSFENEGKVVQHDGSSNVLTCTPYCNAVTQFGRPEHFSKADELALYGERGKNVDAFYELYDHHSDHHSK